MLIVSFITAIPDQALCYHLCHMGSPLRLSARPCSLIVEGENSNQSSLQFRRMIELVAECSVLCSRPLSVLLMDLALDGHKPATSITAKESQRFQTSQQLCDISLSVTTPCAVHCLCVKSAAAAWHGDDINRRGRSHVQDSFFICPISVIVPTVLTSSHQWQN